MVGSLMSDLIINVARYLHGLTFSLQTVQTPERISWRDGHQKEISTSQRRLVRDFCAIKALRILNQSFISDTVTMAI